MITKIGIVSGEILNLLEDKKTSMTIEEIKSFLDEPVDVITMSIGWLIRENYVRVENGSEQHFLLVSENASSLEALQNG